MPDHHAPTVYTTEQTAPRLHPDLSPRTLERWRRQGKGPAYTKVGKFVVYTEEAIAAYLRQQTRTPEAA